jgi:hypothetical protein
MKSGARELYEAHMVEVLSRVWKREGDFLTVEPAHLETPVTELLERELGSTRVDPDWLPSDQQSLRGLDQAELMGLVLELMHERDGTRLNALKTLMTFFFSRGPEPLNVAELVYMVAEVMHEDLAWRMNGTEVADVFGRSKQDWQNLREKMIEELVRRWTREDMVLGGGKSHAARQKYKDGKKGNTSRLLGRKRGDELRRPAAAEDDGLKISREARKRAERMRVQAEKRDLAREIGCDPSEIDLGKISPKYD